MSESSDDNFSGSESDEQPVEKPTKNGKSQKSRLPQKQEKLKQKKRKDSDSDSSDDDEDKQKQPEKKRKTLRDYLNEKVNAFEMKFNFL